MFVERESNFATHFAAACRADDTEAAIRLAHDLKGEAAALGAVALSEAAAAVERACSDHATAADVDALFEAVTAQLDLVIARLRSMQMVAKA
jgi:two-component system sensor histidine kinase/response regulator